MVCVFFFFFHTCCSNFCFTQLHFPQTETKVMVSFLISFPGLLEQDYFIPRPAGTHSQACWNKTISFQGLLEQDYFIPRLKLCSKPHAKYGCVNQMEFLSTMLAWVWRHVMWKNQKIARNPHILGRLNACANSVYQALLRFYRMPGTRL